MIYKIGDIVYVVGRNGVHLGTWRVLGYKNGYTSNFRYMLEYLKGGEVYTGDYMWATERMLKLVPKVVRELLK